MLCDRKLKVKSKGKVYRTVVRPALVYGGRDMGIDEGTGKEIGCRNDNGCAELRSWTR